MKAVLAISLVLVVGCASEAVVPAPQVPAAKKVAAPEPEPAVVAEPVAPPVVAEPAGPSDLELARGMAHALSGHQEETERKRAEDRAKFDEMMSRPMGGLGDLTGAGSVFGGGLGGLGLSGSGMGGGGGSIGLGGGGTAEGLGGLGTRGSGGTSKQTTTKKPAKSSKPKTPPKKK